MIFNITDGNLSALLDDPKRRNQHRLDLSTFPVLPEEELNRLLNATEKFISPKTPETQRAYLHSAFSLLGKYLSARSKTNLPSTFNDWQFLILDWYAWYLSNKESKASIISRVSQWDNFVVPLVKGLTDEGLLPIGLVIPTKKFRREIISTRSPRHPDLLGEAPAKEADYKTDPINKTLAGPIFWRSDLDYLKEIENSIHSRNKLLKGVADDYWLRLIKDYRQGRKLLRKIPENEFLRRVHAKDWRRQVPCNLPTRSTIYRRVTDPRVENSSPWALGVLEYILKTENDENCFSTERLQKNKAFLDRFLHTQKHTPIHDLLRSTSLRADQLSKVDRRTMFARFLGILTPLDMAVAMAILIQEHPNINPESLGEAKLLNSRGKSYLIVSDNKAHPIFSVDKPRARSRKYSALSHRAQIVIKHVIRATELVRQLLRRSGSKHWRYLFVGYSTGSWNILGHPVIRASLLTDLNRQSLSRLYPELAAGGLTQDTLSFSKIRTTQGVLEWFSSGSLHKVSRKLGNSYNVVLEHYIPKPLIRLWNERIIRRFQNTLIALAASNEDYLVEVTDMQDYEELMSFLAQVLMENPTGHSPIGDSLHQRFNFSEDRTVPNDPNSMLSLRIEGNSLALLYAFDHITRSKISPKAMRIVDPNTGLSPKHFVDLSTLLKQAAESEVISEALGESLELYKLKKAHASACELLPSLIRKINHLQISATWN